MSTYYSTEVTQVKAGTPVSESGAVRVIPFKYVVPAGGIAAGSVVLLGIVPKGAKPLMGFFTNTAGGAAATAEVGIYSKTDESVVDADEFGALTDMTGITSQWFANTNAYGHNVALADDYWFGIVTAAQTIQAAAVLSGFLLVRL